MEGERGGTPFHQIFCGWNVPPNIVGVSRNGGAVAFRQVPCHILQWRKLKTNEGITIVLLGKITLCRPSVMHYDSVFYK